MSSSRSKWVREPDYYPAASYHDSCCTGRAKCTIWCQFCWKCHRRCSELKLCQKFSMDIANCRPRTCALCFYPAALLMLLKHWRCEHTRLLGLALPPWQCFRRTWCLVGLWSTCALRVPTWKCNWRCQLTLSLVDLCYYPATILMLHWWDIVVGLWVVVGRCTNGANAGFDDRRLLIGRSSGAMVV